MLFLVLQQPILQVLQAGCGDRLDAVVNRQPVKSCAEQIARQGLYTAELPDSLAV